LNGCPVLSLTQPSCPLGLRTSTLRTFLFKIFCAASSCAMASPATALANSASSRPPLTSSASSGRFCTLRAVSLVSKAAAVRFEDIGSMLCFGCDDSFSV